MANYTIKRNDEDRDKVFLLKTLRNMIARCNGRYEQYISYTRKDIRVCKEWMENPLCFVEWAKSNGWKKGLTIDRIDNDSGYSPGNCRWISNRENILLSEESRISRGASKYVGVWFRKDSKHWTAEVKVDKVKISLGVFETEEDAMLYREYYLNKNSIPYLKRNIDCIPKDYVPTKIINSWRDLEEDVLFEIFSRSKTESASSLGIEYGISRKAIPAIIMIFS